MVSTFASLPGTTPSLRVHKVHLATNLVQINGTLEEKEIKFNKNLHLSIPPSWAVFLPCQKSPLRSRPFSYSFSVLQHPTPVQQHHQWSFKYSQLATTLASSSISKIMEETVYKMYLQLQDYMHWAENHAELSLLNSNLPRLLSLHLKHQKPCINLDISGVQQTAVTLTNRRLVHPSEIFALFYGVFFPQGVKFCSSLLWLFYHKATEPQETRLLLHTTTKQAGS